MQIDPAAPTVDPAATIASLQAQVDALTAQLHAGPAATSDAAAASSPDAGAPTTTEPAPVSSVPAPPVGTLVRQSVTEPGQENPTDRFGIVVAVDDDHHTGDVAWFTGAPTSVAGVELTQVA